MLGIYRDETTFSILAETRPALLMLMRSNANSHMLICNRLLERGEHADAMQYQVRLPVMFHAIAHSSSLNGQIMPYIDAIVFVYFLLPFFFPPPAPPPPVFKAAWPKSLMCWNNCVLEGNPALHA